MQLTHLSLTNFRSIARLDVEVPPGPLLLVGANAQGKTTLLEAVYYLATFVSFQASNERQLINMTAGREPLAVTRILADFERQGSRPLALGSLNPGQHNLEVRLIQETEAFETSPRLRKEVLLDKVKYKISQVVGAFNAVLFLPYMLQVVEGSPEERRRYINLAIGQVQHGYTTALAEYQRVLAQRNALLKSLNERNSLTPDNTNQLTYWDELLARYGAQLMHARIQAVGEMEMLAARYHRELTRNQEALRLSYQPSFEPLPRHPGQFVLPLGDLPDRSHLAIEKIEEAFLKSLEQNRNEDIGRGLTTTGPHRDDLRFLSNRLDLGVYGSRGQARTAMLSIKLAEVAWIQEKTNQWPVLLLDEVLAELDPQRRLDLLSRLGQSEQALLTTTDPDLFPPEFTRKATVWHIQSGRIMP